MYVKKMKTIRINGITTNSASLIILNLLSFHSVSLFFFISFIKPLSNLLRTKNMSSTISRVMFSQ